jgi:hypothetical protein
LGDGAVRWSETGSPSPPTSTKDQTGNALAAAETIDTRVQDADVSVAVSSDGGLGQGEPGRAFPPENADVAERLRLVEAKMDQLLNIIEASGAAEPGANEKGEVARPAASLIPTGARNSSGDVFAPCDRIGYPTPPMTR